MREPPLGLLRRHARAGGEALDLVARELPDVAFAAVPTWGTTDRDLQALRELPNITLLDPVEDIDKLLLTKLPDVLTADQKTNRVHNLLVSLSGKRIRNAGTRQDFRWVLIDSLISDPAIKGGD